MSRIERFANPLPVPLSKAVKAGGFLFLSGHLPMNADGSILKGDIKVQTRFALERIAQTLQEVGSSMNDVVKATVWLSTLDDFAAFNEEYRKHFPGGVPSRSTVEAKLYKGALVEIEVQAFVG
jgi:2-iminobutanoate/2-iminopropanoate deaminase